MGDRSGEQQQSQRLRAALPRVSADAPVKPVSEEGDDAGEQFPAGAQCSGRGSGWNEDTAQSQVRELGEPLAEEEEEGQDIVLSPA